MSKHAAEDARVSSMVARENLLSVDEGEKTLFPIGDPMLFRLFLFRICLCFYTCVFFYVLLCVCVFSTHFLS